MDIVKYVRLYGHKEMRIKLVWQGAVGPVHPRERVISPEDLEEGDALLIPIRKISNDPRAASRKYRWLFPIIIWLARKLDY